MQLMYALFVLLQPAQRRRDYNVVKILPSAIGSSHTDWTRSAYLSFHRDHHCVELEVRLCEGNRRNSVNNLLVVRGYEAVVCKHQRYTPKIQSFSLPPAMQSSR